MEEPKAILSPTQNEALKKEIYCPSCGKFVGAYERCPHCQAVIKKRLPFIIMRRVSVIGSLIGLILLWFAAYKKDVPPIKVEDIQISMNNALVKIHGTVLRRYIEKEKNSFKLDLDDGTGRIRLGGFNKLARFQKEFGKNMPDVGDEIEVTGNLSISDAFGATMFLSSPARLKIIKKFRIISKKISEITTLDVGKLYKIIAKIKSVKPFTKKGKTILYSIKLGDKTGEIDATIFASELKKIKDDTVKKYIVKPGTIISSMIQVSQYKNQLQLKLMDINDPEKLKILKKGHGKMTEYKGTSNRKYKTPKIKLSDINQKLVGKYYMIEAEVARFRTNRGGTLLTLTDESGRKIDCFIFKKTFSKIKDRNKLRIEGTKIRAKVKVNEFRNKLQLQVGWADNLWIQ